MQEPVFLRVPHFCLQTKFWFLVKSAGHGDRVVLALLTIEVPFVGFASGRRHTACSLAALEEP